MTDPKDKKMDSSKVVVQSDPKKDQGLKPLKGAELAIKGLEMRISMINFEKKKIQQLIFKATRLAEAGKAEEMTKVTEEMERRSKELTRLEEDFAGRCRELGLVPTDIKPNK